MASTAPRKRAAKRSGGRATTHDVQSAVEGVAVEPAEVKTVNGEVVPSDEAVEYLGVWYRIDDRIPPMVLMKFAAAADHGVDSATPAGLAAMYAMLRSCLRDDDWPPFEAAALTDRDDVDGTRLLGVVRSVQEKLAARPTKRPGDSSPGPRSTSASSKVSSSLPDTVRRDGLVPVGELLGQSTP